MEAFSIANPGLAPLAPPVVRVEDELGRVWDVSLEPIADVPASCRPFPVVNTRLASATSAETSGPMGILRDPTTLPCKACVRPPSG